VVGQNELKERLISTVVEKRVSHAQIFEGTMGYGGLPIALAYAQFISCKNRGADDSCGVCPSCVKYNKLIHPDLHFVFPVNTTKKIKEKPVSDHFLPEWRQIVLDKKYFNEQDWYESIGIDKQGNISAYEADKILYKLNLKPFESDDKIMIIWLPERLNSTSANRLLKLIEEPPSNTIFFFITESPNKVLPTIYSRTQRIRLHPIESESMIEALKKSNFNETETYTASRLSGGDYLRAIQILETSDSAKVHFDNFVQFMRLSYQNDILGLLDWAELMSSTGREKQKSFLIFAERLVRENFILNKNADIVYLGFEELEWAKKFSRFITENNITEIYNQLNICIPQISQNGNAKLIFTDLALKMKELIRPK
jgi:DNA polymerase-3 subunit delta'